MFFDTHAHLDDPKLLSDHAQIMENMAQAGVTHCVLVGDGAGDPMGSYELAQQHKHFYWAAGVHPHTADDYSSLHEVRLRQWMAMPKAVALGEIGLDYHYDFSDRQTQRDVFDAQLALAYELGKPVIMHVREAHGDAINILTARSNSGKLPAGIMHCYTGSWESAKQYLKMGFYISIAGTVTFKNAPKVWQVAENVPEDRLLIETDCPYMAPVPMRGKRNEPSFVRYTAQRIAELRGVPLEQIAKAAMQNGLRAFNIESTSQEESL